MDKGKLYIVVELERDEIQFSLSHLAFYDVII